MNKIHFKLLLTICGASLFVMAASAQSPNLQGTVEQNDHPPFQGNVQQTDRLPFQGKATQADQLPVQLQADKNKLEGSIQQGNKLSPWYGTPAGQLQEQLPQPAPQRLSSVQPLMPYYGDPNQATKSQPPPERPSMVWQLQDLTAELYRPGLNAQLSGPNGIRPSDLSGQRVIRLNGRNPNLPPVWKEWYRNVMHMIYSNLQHIDGGGGDQVFIWIRSDGAIKANPAGQAGPTYAAVMSLQGLPQLKFDPVDGCDTVMLELHAWKADPNIRDLWGRTIGSNSRAW